MDIEYLPNTGFIINENLFRWEMQREIVRKLLNNQHEEQLHRKRDVYENYHKSDSYFFLNYNEQNYLQELEVHWGLNVVLNNLAIIFDTDIHQTLTALQVNSYQYKELSTGGYFFDSLKMLLATNEKMGGEGEGISYFYASVNVDHLKND